MLKRIGTFIIGLIPLLLLAILGVIIAITFLDSTEKINQWQTFFRNLRNYFLTLHLFFYLALFCLWPTLIRLIARRKHIVLDKQQWQIAMKGRFYLLGLFILFEFFFLRIA